MANRTTIYRTIGEQMKFKNSALMYINAKKEDNPNGAELNTRRAYAMKRVIDDIDKNLEKYNAKYRDVLVDHALEDPATKELLKGPDGNFRYTKEGQKEVNKVIQQLNEETYPVRTYFINTDTKDLSFTQLEDFNFYILDDFFEYEDPATFEELEKISFQKKKGDDINDRAFNPLEYDGADKKDPEIEDNYGNLKNQPEPKSCKVIDFF